jgi:hypothetical protein
MSDVNFIGFSFSALVQLGAHRFYAPPRHAVGLPVLRTDEAAFPEALKQVERAVRQHKAIAGDAGYVAYFATIAPFMADHPAKGEFVQNTLFVL